MRRMLGRRARIGLVLLLVGVGSLLVAALALLAAAHLPGVQRAAWNRLVREVEEATGWRVSAAEVGAKLLWGPRLELVDLRVGSVGRTIATADRAVVVSSWRDLLSSPPRLEEVAVDGLTVDLTQLELPERPPAAEAGGVADPWRALEIGGLRVRGISIGAEIADIELELADAAVSGMLENGSAEVEASVARISVSRADRRLAIGPLELAASASDRGVEVERLTLDGDAVSGSMTLTGDVAEGRAEGTGTVALALRPLMEWYDPNLVTLVDPRGRLVLAFDGSLVPGQALEVTVTHTGSPVELAGYPIESLQLSSVGTHLRVDAGAAKWGEVSAELADGAARVRARLVGAAVGPAIARFSGPPPEWIPGPITISGTIDAIMPVPPIPERVTARVDLRAASPGGHAELRGQGTGLAWQLDRLVVELPGVTASGNGSIKGVESVQASLTVEVADPERLKTHLQQWLPNLEELAVAGGPAVADVNIAGSLDRPSVDAAFEWREPLVAGVALDRIEATATGNLEEIAWWLVAKPVGDASIELAGTAEPEIRSVSGRWTASAPEIEALAGLVQPRLEDRLGGEVESGGTFQWSGNDWGVNGNLRAKRARFDDWQLDAAAVEIEASPDRVEVQRLDLQLLGGTVRGSGSVILGGVDRSVQAELSWSGIDPSMLPIDVPAEAVAGRLDGSLEVNGTIWRPAGRLGVTWMGSAGGGIVRSGTLHATLADGVVDLTSENLDTAAGPLALTGRLPLGDVPRPPALWPDAPRGPLELTAVGSRLDLGAVALALGRGPLPVDVGSDMALRLRWSFSDPLDRLGLLELDGFSIRHAGGEVTAPDGIDVRVEQGVVILDRTRLVGPRGVVQVAGEFDPVAEHIRLEVDGELSPEIAQVIPYPVRVKEPLTVRMSVEGPLASPVGSFVIDHRGGTIVVRDPPVEITDLRLAGSLSNGSLWIDDGAAGVNRGRVHFGGGWDPESGQGIVVELEEVTFFAEGTLTRWSGLLAIEPDPEATARIAGDLVLDGGVWEQPADIAGAFLAGAQVEPAADDPLNGIALDLTVRARTGIRVDNNLGRFDVRWDRLRVTGSAARPVVRGDIRIATGGVVNLPGKRMELQRGTIRFTGDPSVDPVLELVPAENLATYGGGVSGDQKGIDTYALAAQTLYGGVGRALGFENETLQPASIAIETETELTSQFLLGQRLSPNLAFFFAGNPSDVQDRTTMLQLWNLDFDPGLAIQAYQKTLDDRSGMTALQRFQWGGSAGRVGLPFSRRGSVGADRPIIHRVRLEGDWPISKRRLKRASGLRRGIPYEPFLDFVAEVHLEQRLAAEGYPEAQVQGRTEGSERSPTLVYTCDPGPYYEIDFVGDTPPEMVQREVRALYMPPPLEPVAVENMREVLLRHYRASGFPFAAVRSEREVGRLVLAIVKGAPLEYRGPVVEGVPERGARLIRDVLGSPAELAIAVEDPERAGRIVAGVLTGIGYTNARLVDVSTRPVDDRTLEVRLVVDPGEVARIGAVEIRGRDPLGLTETLGDVVAVGAPLDRRAIDDKIAEIRRQYQQSGYDQVSVRAVPHRGEDGSWLVVVELEPGVQRTLEDVQFSGLRHIEPRYLRTGLQLADGDLLNVFEVDESAVRIANFGPVERLEVTTRPIGTGGSVVDFEVFEKPRWTVEFGLGWDNDRGLEVRSGLRDDNLFGRGVGANLRLRWNEIERVALLYGALPPLPGRRISFGGTLGYRDEEGELQLALGPPLPYREIESLASLELNYDAAPGTTLKPYVRYTRTRYDYEDYIIDLDTTIATTTLGTALFMDRFDNPFDPRIGYGIVTDIGWSTSYLASDVDTLQAALSGSLALEPWSEWTWLQTIRFGVAEPLMGTVLDPGVRLKAGGQGSIRGFERDSVGPVGVGGEPIGGGALFILNEELRVPVWRSFRGAVFTDIGQVWESWSEADTRLSMSVGLGLRWSTPIGLVWGDVAWPVANVDNSSRKPKFYIGIGRPF